MQSENLFFIVPAICASTFLVGSDTGSRASCPRAPAPSITPPILPMPEQPPLLGAQRRACFLWRDEDHDDHERETGFLAGEAASDAYLDVTAFKYIAGRERPDTGNNRGNFFSGGDSFPSDTSAVSWAAASVIAREYPGSATQLLAYGTAGGVSAARVVGQKHWMSDAILGSALGWYMGRQVFRARARPMKSIRELGEPSSSLRTTRLPIPSFMGTTYVPLDSWVYPALDRLEALGYLPEYVQAIRPMARLEVARLTLQAQESVGYPEVHNESARVVGELRRSSRLSWRIWKALPTSAAQLESAYAARHRNHGHADRRQLPLRPDALQRLRPSLWTGFQQHVGASMRAEAGPLAFYIRGEYQHSASIAPYSPSTAQAIANVDQLPLNSVPTFPGAEPVQHHRGLCRAEHEQLADVLRPAEPGLGTGLRRLADAFEQCASHAHAARAAASYSVPASRAVGVAGHDSQ